MTAGAKSVSSVTEAVDKAEAEDLKHELRERERNARRHTLWMLLGVSPAGLIPLLAVANDFGVAALLTGAVCITGVEAWRATLARRDAAELRERLRQLTSATDSTSEGPARPDPADQVSS